MLCSFILVQNVCYQDFVSLSMERVFSHAAPMEYSKILTANCLMCKTLCIGQGKQQCRSPENNVKNKKIWHEKHR